MNSPIREIRKQRKEREGRQYRENATDIHKRLPEPPAPASPRQPYNTVRITFDGQYLHIQEGTLDINGIEKFRKELDAYETVLRLNSSDEEGEE